MCYNFSTRRGTPRLVSYGGSDVPYTIRRMVKEDLEQVTEIDREAFPTQWPPANYRHELNNRLAHYIVARDNMRTVETTEEVAQKGLLSWLRPWLRRDGLREGEPATVHREFLVGFSGIWVMVDEAHITNIAVRQHYQGRGLGELLLTATIDLARELNASMMTLEVRVSNTSAQKLYMKYGFVETGVRRGYYLDNREDALIMSTESIISSGYQERLEKLREDLDRKLKHAG